MSKRDHGFAVAAHFIRFGISACSLVEMFGRCREFGGDGTSVGPHGVSQAYWRSQERGEIHGGEEPRLVNHWHGRVNFGKVNLVPVMVSTSNGGVWRVEYGGWGLVQFVDDIL